MTPRSIVSASVMLLCVQTAPALAQRGSILGVVRDSAGQPLSNAEVIVLPDRRARTDSAGQFRFDDLPLETYTIRARRVGYYPAEHIARLRATPRTVIGFALTRRPVLLDTITVRAGSCERRQLSGFFCRKKTGHGIYLDEEAIDSANARFPEDLLRDRDGFRVEPAQGKLIVTATSGWRCLVNLANGYPVSLQNPLPNWPGDLVGVEIYRDPDDVPPEYQTYAYGSTRMGRRNVSARCSVIVYWTLPRPRKR